MIYLDGQRIDNADQTYGSFVKPYAGSDIPLTLGAQVSPGGSFAGQFNGSQKDVRLYSRALSESEIATLYSNGANPTPAVPVEPLLPPTLLHIVTPK